MEDNVGLSGFKIFHRFFILANYLFSASLSIGFFPVFFSSDIFWDFLWAIDLIYLAGKNCLYCYLNEGKKIVTLFYFYDTILLIMERKVGQSYKSNTWGEIKRKLSQGIRDTKSGVIHIGKGIFEVVKGSVEVVDVAALGLGAIAILALGGVGVAPLWAMVSKEKDIAEAGREIAKLSANSKVARVFGYPLLILAGGYSYLRLTEK